MSIVYDFNWIIGIIKSCNTPFHFEGVDKLIELFKQKYARVSDDKVACVPTTIQEMTMELEAQRDRRWEIIH